MLVKVRRSKSNEWGFLEKYESYSYKGNGYVRALCSVNTNGELCPSYIFKGEEFVPLSKSDEGVSIERYIKAKKPFYSKVKNCFIVLLKAEVNFETGEYFPEKSTFEVYVSNGNPLPTGLPLKRVIDVPKQFYDIVEEPLRLLGESMGDRSKFLRGRCDG